MARPSSRANARHLVWALLLAIVLSVALAAAGPAAARPDPHDRALVARLAQKVMTFRAIAKRADRGTKRITSLDHCAAVRTPSQAFAAVIALLPAVLIDLVNEIKPQLLGLRRTLAGMRPHSRLFGRWLAAVEQNLSLILRFDNHGKKIDYCRAAKVMLAKSSTAHDIERVLGIDPALVALLFRGGSSAPGQTLQSLNAKMRVFLVAAGLSRHQAATLTSSY